LTADRYIFNSAKENNERLKPPTHPAITTSRMTWTYFSQLEACTYTIRTLKGLLDNELTEQ